jgi:DNA topoisomerase-1
MGSHKLVIVESPAKARTIGKFLGDEYEIMASVGHIRDLPEHSLGVDLKNDFTPVYIPNPRSSKVIKGLKAIAKKSDAIYLAPDPDREGEAIAWHLKEVLKDNSKAEFHRVSFHEITRTAINKAFESPSDINMNLVDSQQARRVLDRLVGYQISPLLWTRIEKGISAGRVQSVALRLVCEREREILAFEPEEYWNFLIQLDALSPNSGKTFQSKLVKIDDEKLEIGDSDNAAKALTAIKQAECFKILSVETAPRRRNPFPPFITSTMQQAASSALGFSASRTMSIAQQLYEGVERGNSEGGGLITYMRTDSVAVAKEAQDACRDFISRNLGDNFLPNKPNVYRSKASAQEAHEAIRPTDVNQTPESLSSYLEPQQLRLYTLIWKRFVASQMSPAQQKRTTVEVETRGSDLRNYLFRTTATVTVFPGFMKMYEAVEKDDDEQEYNAPAILAELKKGEICYLKDAASEQKFTEPPPRYSEASLIKELEANGIGRPSTYASILGTIQKRDYVTREKGRLQPSELGFKVNDFLVTTLPELFQVGFTAEMEAKLDDIEIGKLSWTAMLKDFYADFEVWIEDAKNIGAPEQAKVKALIEMMKNIQWAPPEKNGRRSYDDGKFFSSVEEKFIKSGNITAKQWEALLKIAGKYESQLPQLDSVASKYNFLNELNDAKIQQAAAIEKRINSIASDEIKAKYEVIFAGFDQVKWAEPVKRRNRVYDDKKFFDSLKKQTESGKVLSERQFSALGKIALKYREQIADFDKLAFALGVDPSAPEAEGVANSEEVVQILEKMAKVGNWAEPVKKGRRVYDDKAFFESLSDQNKSGRAFSPRQVAALKKLAGKYSIG